MHLNQDDQTEDDVLLHWVETAFQRYAPQDKSEPWKIGLAVSGGGDSMAMLHLFAQCAMEHNYELHVATVDHRLRKEAKDEAQFVAETCRSMALPHSTLVWGGWTGDGNLQAQARNARYELLAGWAKENGLSTVAIGHTKDDVAETFLARLARGSGLDGLAEMERHFRRHDVQFTRPCLSLHRKMLRNFLRRHGHGWCDDPSNEDTKYQRVKARQALVALEPLGIDAAQIGSTAFQLSAAKHVLEQITKDTARDLVRLDAGDFVLDWTKFTTTNYEIKRRLLNAMLTWIGQTDYPPRSNAILELLNQISLRNDRNLNGCIVSSGKSEIRIGREFEAVKSKVCKTNEEWDARWRLEGPHGEGLEIRALGEEGLRLTKDWRGAGLPRTSLLSSPAIWSGDELIAAPLAKLNPEWSATLTRGEKQFFSSMVTH